MDCVSKIIIITKAKAHTALAGARSESLAVALWSKCHYYGHWSSDVQKWCAHHSVSGAELKFKLGPSRASHLLPRAVHR